MDFPALYRTARLLRSQPFQIALQEADVFTIFFSGHLQIQLQREIDKPAVTRLQLDLLHVNFILDDAFIFMNSKIPVHRNDKALQRLAGFYSRLIPHITG
ncbi:hypothetical protein D3C77_409100 [compost metagenome]